MVELDWEDLLIEAMKSKTRVRILKYIINAGGANISRISRELGISYTSAERNLEALSKAGILEEVKLGRVRVYKMGEGESIIKLIKCLTGRD
ncbi:winged helix-turn-helix domain-containing protein [Candidatus Korarchaeum cryptofilum]|uniref:winged helix-turn-helix domain-containing protein n=1 Tax=Candidatus Korarchaeum cryptofilum TaxID=498846 RepID=UPI000696EE4C|nr:winged helix-turn-helix domain-containing protein [Candidatus Korarchaeum cryptofilum]